MSHREKAIMARITAAFFALVGIILVLVFRLEHSSAFSVVMCSAICLGMSVYADIESRKDDHGPSPEANSLPPEEGPPASGP